MIRRFTRESRQIKAFPNSEVTWRVFLRMKNVWFKHCSISDKISETRALRFCEPKHIFSSLNHVSISDKIHETWDFAIFVFQQNRLATKVVLIKKISAELQIKW